MHAHPIAVISPYFCVCDGDVMMMCSQICFYLSSVSVCSRTSNFSIISCVTLTIPDLVTWYP